MSSMDRALGRSERWYWIADQYSCINVVAQLRMTADIDAPRVEKALKDLRALYPSLGARIVTDGLGKNPRFVTEGTGPTPLRVGTSSAETEVDHELNERFAPHDPLFRAVYIPNAGCVLLTMSHVLFDGISAATLVKAFVAVATDSVDDEGQGAVRAALETLIPRKYRGWRALILILAMQLRQLLVLLRRPRRLAIDTHVPFDQRKSRAIGKELGPEDMSSVIERCRREQVTVHGALSAAMVRAVAEDLAASTPSVTPTIGLGSPIDLRRHLEPALGHDLGVYVSSIFTFHTLTSGISLWRIAREVNEQMERAVARGEPFTLLRFSELIGYHRPERSRDVLRLVEARGPGNVTLTNLGRVDLPQRAGLLGVQEVRFYAALSVSGYFLGMPSTTNGKLFWSFVYVEGILKRARAERLASKCLESLMAGVRERSTP